MESTGIGERVRALRGQLSLPSFAEALDVHKSTIMRWEREESYPDASLIKKMCEIYGAEPAWLVLGQKTQSMNWSALEGILVEVLEVFEEFGLALPVSKKAKLIVILCKQAMGREGGASEVRGMATELIKIAS
jgi:transcriptional regulator with XRE-family HTH domain